MMTTPTTPMHHLKHPAFPIAVLVAILALAGAIVTLAPESGLADGNAVEIDYSGELRDEKNQPIAGIYPLEFKLYAKPKDTKPIWSETHWVAVKDGRYALRLGSENRIRKTLAKPGQPLELGVFLGGNTELLREAITFPTGKESSKDSNAKPKEEPKGTSPAKDPKATESPTADDKGKASPKPTFKTESSFAELADYARRAGVAEDAEKVGGKSIDELEAEIEKLREQLAELRVMVRKRSDNPSVGSDIKILPRVGGTGGAPFSRQCPPG
ncbi:MAG: hypothetical protein AAFS10_16500, partial [Myxococcota bacterium]